MKFFRVWLSKFFSSRMKFFRAWLSKFFSSRVKFFISLAVEVYSAFLTSKSVLASLARYESVSSAIAFTV